MIGIAARRGGGGISVTTTYLDNYFETLDAGFTPTGSGTSGNKYHADRESVELLSNWLTAAKNASETVVSVLTYTNVYVAISIAECEADLLELATNEIQALIHYYG